MATRKVNSYLRILGNEPEYQSLFTRIKKINEIQQSLLTIVPSHLAKYCAVGLPRNGKLTIFAQNGAVATRLKHISPSLLEKLQNHGWQITAIHIATQAYHQANDSENYNRKGRKRRLGQGGVTSFTQLATSLPESGLKTAIASLLKKASRS